MWKSENDYISAAKELIIKFQNNFAQYDIHDKNIKNAGPNFDL